MPRTFTTRPFSKVVRDTWGDERFMALSALRPSGQALWLYLLTGPHCNVIPGLFVGMGVGALADRLKWPAADVRRCWSEIEAANMAEADWAAGVIWLPNGFRHNEPANPNQVTAWRNVPLPQCDLVRGALRVLRGHLVRFEEARVAALIAKGKDPSETKGWLDAFDEVFRKGFPGIVVNHSLNGSGNGSLNGFGNGSVNHSGNGFANGSGNQEQEQEQEQDLLSPLPPAGAGARITRREFKQAEAELQAFRDDERRKYLDSGGPDPGSPLWQQREELAAQGRTFADLYQRRPCMHEPPCAVHGECLIRIVVALRARTQAVMADAVGATR